MKAVQKVIYIIGVLLALVGGTACTKINDNQIPSYPVNLNLSTPGYWQTYGVTSPGTYRLFNKMERIPENYPYNANSYTGFGGVFLVCDIFTSEPLAYDASCPVERRAEVRVAIDENCNYEAVCPKCGSHYNVMSGWGGAVSGKAYSQKLGLNRYRVIKTGSGYNVVN